MLTAHVTINRGASDEEVSAVEALFGSVGIQAEVEVRDLGYLPGPDGGPPLRTGGQGPEAVWLLILAIAWSPFLKRLAELAAEDTYALLKDLVSRAGQARLLSGGPACKVEIYDPDSRVSIVDLDAALSDDAYEALLEVDLGSLTSGELTWDQERRQWEQRR